MATLINSKGLPQTLVDALAYDTYKVKGDLSVTSMIDAPQIRVLKKKHSHEIVTDAADMLWALMGTVMHSILERSHIKDKKKQAFVTVIETLTEEIPKHNKEDKLEMEQTLNSLIKFMLKMFPDVESRYIYELSLSYEHEGVLAYGTLDIYDKLEKKLSDYKMCSVYAYIYPESRKKWDKQTNVYAFYLRENGYEVDLIDIVAIFRDWSATKAETSKGDYPPQQFMTIPIVVRSQEFVRKYVNERIELHKRAEAGDIPECTGEERWSTATEWVVKTPKLKRAVRKFATEEEADKFIIQNKPSYEFGLNKFVQHGESRRCAKYCPVADFCPQKAKEDKERENGN